MGIIAKDIDDTINFAFKTATRVKDFSKLAKRNSIMKMAAPAIYQYPILMSSEIETPVAMAIAQAYQQTYASSVVTAYSLNPVMSLKDYREPSDFVKKFHSNDVIPTNVRAAANVIGVTDLNGLESAAELEFDVADATITRNFSKEVLESLSTYAWDRVEDYVDNESLNNIYRPYDRTKRILSEKVDSLKAANEDFKSSFDKLSNFISDVNDSVTADDAERSNYALNCGTQERRFTNGVVRKDRLDAMEPTMVNVQIVCHGDNKTQSNLQFTQNLVIGVKAMVRLVTSDLMVASMVEACKDTNVVFKFLKWTKGERKTLDFVLGISKAKKKALAKNAKMEIKILEQSRKRGKAGVLKRALKNEVLPTLSIVLTTYEVERIKEICGVDLTDLKQAIKLMNKYYLLSLAIYDPTQNTLQTMFDCDDDWSFVSIANMKTMIDKVTDIMNQNETAKILGRR